MLRMHLWQRWASENNGGGAHVSDQRAVDCRSTESSIQWHQWVTCIIIITSGQSKLTSDCITTADRWFSRIHQVAPMCPHREGTLAPPGEYNWTCASFGSPESITQTANRLVLPFLHIARQKVPMLYNGRPFPPKLPLLVGDLDPHLIHDSVSQTEHTTQTACGSVQLFLHRWLHNVPALYNGAPLSPKIAPSHGGSGPSANTWFLGPIRAHKPNVISICSAVFALVTAECPYTLQWDAAFPLKIVPSQFPWGIWTPI